MFAEIIPEYLVICEEVYFEDLLLPLLQIGAQGYLDYTIKI